MAGSVQERAQNVIADSVIRHLIGHIVGGENAQHQHRKNGAHAAQRHQAEGIFLTLFITQDAGNTNAQRHDKGHRNGSGGNTAGVKGHGKQFFIAADYQHQRQGKQKHIEEHQNTAQSSAEHDTKNRNDQKRTDADTYGIYQNRAVHHGGHLVGKHLQIRLGHGDQHTQDETHSQQQPQFLLTGKAGAYMGAHGGHGQVGSQVKKTDSKDQHHRSDGKSN